MKEKDEWIDPLRRLIKYHEEVSEYLENLKEASDFLLEKESWSKIKSMKDFFQRNIIDHFKFEEEVIFPPLLLGFATQETIKLILELQREHGNILNELKAFQKITSKMSLDSKTSEELQAVSKKVMANLLDHAKKEDKKLLPILKEHRHLLKAQKGI